MGSSMMLEVERLLQSAGCPKINLKIRDTNAEAIGFYSALGYRRDEVRYLSTSPSNVSR